MTLDKIGLNDCVVIDHIEGELSIKRRLFDLGFIPGAKVECVLVSPFKDPKAYQISGNTIALRRVDARNIEVSYETN